MKRPIHNTDSTINQSNSNIGSVINPPVAKKIKTESANTDPSSNVTNSFFDFHYRPSAFKPVVGTNFSFMKSIPNEEPVTSGGPSRLHPKGLPPQMGSSFHSGMRSP